MSSNVVAHIVDRFVDVSGIRTHYLEAGDGPTLVLLHSGEFGASAALTWEFNIAALARHFRVIAPDWLGYGETDKLRDFGASNSERMLRHMADFLRVIDVRKAHFAGCSMGGTMLVREAASDHCRFPIKRMILCSGGGFVPDNERRRSMLSYDGTAQGMRRILEATFNDPRWWEDDDYVERRVRASLAPGAWEWIEATRLKAPNIPPRSNFGQEDTVVYENVTVPTLIVAGAHDKLRLPYYYRPMIERMPNASVHVVEEAGHLLNIEQSEAFNVATLGFLLQDSNA